LTIKFTQSTGLAAGAISHEHLAVSLFRLMLIANCYLPNCPEKLYDLLNSAHRSSKGYSPLAITCARPALVIARPFAFRAATPAEISKVLIKSISCAFVVTQSIQLSNIVLGF